MQLCKNIIVIVAFMASMHEGFAQLAPWWQTVDTTDAVEIERTAIADSIINYAKTFMGTPYVWGGSKPETGFDCSGFICYVFKQFNIQLPRTSSEQFNAGIPIAYVAAQPGDLILFAGPNNGPGNPGHVGIVIAYNAENGFSFIHTSSPETGGVRISNEKSEGYYNKKFLEIRRVILPN